MYNMYNLPCYFNVEKIQALWKLHVIMSCEIDLLTPFMPKPIKFGEKPSKFDVEQIQSSLYI